MTSPRKGSSGVVVAAVVLVLAAGWSWARATPFWGLDFAQLWTGGKVGRAQGAAIYGTQGQAISNAYLAEAFDQQKSMRLLRVIREREMLAGASRQWAAAFVSTPFLYFTFSGLPGGYESAWLLYRAIALLATVGACLLLCRMAGLSTPAALIFAAAILLLFEPLAADQRVGNTNQLQLLAFAGVLWLIADPRPALRVSGGVLLGLTIGFKPNVALMAPLVVGYRVVRRSWRAAWIDAAAIAGGLGLAVLAGAAWSGSLDPWVAWMDVARGLGQADVPRSLGNIALLKAPVTVTIVMLTVIAGALLSARSLPEDPNHLRLIASLGVIIYLLGANVVWLHYPVLAIPTAALLIGTRVHPIARSAGGGGLVPLAVMPLGFLVPWTDVNVQAGLIFAGLLVLAAGALYVTSRRPESPQPPPRPCS